MPRSPKFMKVQARYKDWSFQEVNWGWN